MRFAWLLLIVSILFGCGVVQAAKPHGDLVDEQKFKDYTVRIYRDTNSDGCFEILRSGRQVFFEEGNKFRVGNVIFESTNTWLKMGQSITSDRQPNLVISEWTGGAHCCFTFLVFQIGDTFKLIDRIDTEHGGHSDFKDLRHDGNVELVTYDWTFAYWNEGFAESPAPEVILCYQNGKYRPDLEMMKKPTTSDPKLKDMAAQIQRKFVDSAAGNEWGAPSDLWGKMLDLIYTGNMDTAWRLLDMSWPAEKGGKKKFLKEFKKKLSASPWYREIERLNMR